MDNLLETGEMFDGDLQLELIEKKPADIERGFVPAYHFAMKNAAYETVGFITLRVGDNDDLRMFSGQIGYRVSPEYRGRRYASRSCRLLFPLARRHQMRELWITCDESNFASRRTCELAGAAFVEIVELPSYHDIYKRGARRSCRYRIAL